MTTKLPHVIISTAELMRNSKKYMDAVVKGEQIFIKRKGVVVAALVKAVSADVQTSDEK